MAFNKEIYLKNIAESLARLSTEVSILNTINLYDINIVSEDFYSELLNLIFEYNFINVNAIEKNSVAIDLIDDINKITIQVTSDNTSEKIKNTIKKYIENERYKSYDRLGILILTKKKNYSVEFDTKGLFSFDKKKDIWDTNDLIKYIRTLDTDKLKTINDYLEKELDSKIYEKKKTQASEVDTIIDLIEYISKNRTIGDKIETEIDPEYKIYKRFKEFADRLIMEYTSLLTIYGESLNLANETLGMDQAQDIITMFYLQDISMEFLDKADSDPVKALEMLVGFFDNKLSENGKMYDRAAIKFYLVNEMIKCRVFPNERSKYDGNK